FSDNPKKSMYITHSEYDLGEDGKEVFTIKGKTLGAWFGQRITIPPIDQSHDIVNANVETIMKEYVDRNAVNPIDISRKIPNLIIAQDKKRGIESTYQTRYKNLDTELE